MFWRQDIYCFGSPCQPFSRLSCHKRKVGYNPFETPGGETFLACAKHIRASAYKHFRFLSNDCVWVQYFAVRVGVWSQCFGLGICSDDFMHFAKRHPDSGDRKPKVVICEQAGVQVMRTVNGKTVQILSLIPYGATFTTQPWIPQIELQTFRLPIFERAGPKYHGQVARGIRWSRPLLPGIRGAVWAGSRKVFQVVWVWPTHRHRCCLQCRVPYSSSMFKPLVHFNLRYHRCLLFWISQIECRDPSSFSAAF